MTKKQWQPLINLDQLEPNDATPVAFGRRLLAVYDTVDGYFVSDARCTHAGANLCDGYFDGKHIECPLHQGLFDARTGRAVAAPVTRDLPMIECRVVDNQIEVLL
ncbi:MAG: Rieske 2Fe-2S domain-containing protein [Pseudomonadota bacterium]